MPTNSAVLLATKDEALHFPKGDIVLGFCPTCGFITNTAYDAMLVEYSSRYESSQGFSATFNRYQRDQVVRLIERYELRDKDIIEIGCGQGEFLTLLCEMGRNRGIGFDPAYNSERAVGNSLSGLRFIQDFFSEQYSYVKADFICCKMTLEHVPETANFVRMVRRTIGNLQDTLVFFQVPDTSRILSDLAFWDFYYEHCSYFSLGSLSWLFQKNGFDILDLTREFDDQYLIITAKPGKGKQQALAQDHHVALLAQGIEHFVDQVGHKLRSWQQRIRMMAQTGQRISIWGASSKGAAFLNTLKIVDEIEYAIDINPYKRGMYIAGTGQKIEAPEFLRQYRPDVIIIMNPVYYQEIVSTLSDLEVAAELIVI
jgi:SAM-dependent methyltransferase